MSRETWIEEFYPIEADQSTIEGAAAHSLRKWEGFTSVNLVRHLVKRPPIDVSGRTCALCHHHYFGRKEEPDCSTCPIAIKRAGVPCDEMIQGEDKSPWEHWVHLRNPEPMLKLLREVCDDAAQNPGA